MSETEGFGRPTDLRLPPATLMLPPALAERILRRLRWARWGAMRWLSPLALATMVGVTIVGSHTPFQGDARILAVSGIAFAGLLTVATGTMSALAIGLVLVSAIGLAASEGRMFGLAAEHGWRCTLTEWVVAAGPLAALWWYSRREVLRFSPLTVAAVAAVGAFAGDAALHVLCLGTMLAPHVWLFHFGGLVAIVAAAALLARRSVD